MISAIGVCGGSICPIQCCFTVKTTFFGSPPVTPDFWRELNLRTHMCSESPGCELQDAPMISAIEAHRGSLCSIQLRLRIKTPFFDSPPVTPGFWRELNLWTHVCSESPGRELQDAPMISSIGACGGRTCPIQCCLRVKTPHFDGLVRAPLTGPRISMATHICLESPLYPVSENTIKSGIRFILGSLYRFWLKRCDFRSVRHLDRSRFFVHRKALKNLHKCY